MPRDKGLGELERRVLLVLLKLGNEVHAVRLSEELERATGRSLSRGALYTTLDRMESKGLITWSTEATTPARGGIPRRAFASTADGVAALRDSHAELKELVETMNTVLGSS